MKLHEMYKSLEESELKIHSKNINNGNELILVVEKEDFRKIIESMFSEYKLYFSGEFCIEEELFLMSTILTNRKYGYFVIVRYKTENDLISLQGLANQSALFEREIQDLYGLKISGGIDTRPLVRHEIWQDNKFPMQKSFTHGEKIKDLYEQPEYNFKKILYGGGFQIPVGPVHAGIIEPGHFRFSVIGESVENLEIRLMYKHRGIEKICENTDISKLHLILERVSGESSVAYAEVYALLIEKMLDVKIPETVKALRVVFLELERIYNFLDDISGICTDIGYSYPAKKFGYLSEMIHQLAQRITGSRYMRNVIVPCGLNLDFTMDMKSDVLETIKKIQKRFGEIAGITMRSISFLDRVEDTGIVENKEAKKLNLTGIPARASGIHYDVRKNFPYEIYREIKNEIKVEETGGVFERYSLKIREIEDAFLFIVSALSRVQNDFVKYRPQIQVEAEKEGFSSVETVKGELIIYGRTGMNNTFERLYIKTPSFMNWEGLAYAAKDEIVPDFPLCNKSFNMSYSENDR